MKAANARMSANMTRQLSDENCGGCGRDGHSRRACLQPCTQAVCRHENGDRQHGHHAMKDCRHPELFAGEYRYDSHQYQHMANHARGMNTPSYHYFTASHAVSRSHQPDFSAANAMIRPQFVKTDAIEYVPHRQAPISMT